MSGHKHASGVPLNPSLKCTGLKMSLDKTLLLANEGLCLGVNRPRGARRSSGVRADRLEAMSRVDTQLQQRCSSGGAVTTFSFPRRIARSFERRVTRDSPNFSAALVRLPPA